MAAALLPCELIERLALERLVNENRSPCRIVSCRQAAQPCSPCQAPGGVPGADQAPPSSGAVCGRWPSPQHSAGAALAPACCCRALLIAPCHPLPDGRPQHPDSPWAVLSPHQGYPGQPGWCGEDGGAPGRPPSPPQGESPPATAGVGWAGGGCRCLLLIPSSPCPGGECKGSWEEEEEGEGEEEGPRAAKPGRGTGQTRRRG